MGTLLTSVAKKYCWRMLDIFLSWQFFLQKNISLSLGHQIAKLKLPTCGQGLSLTQKPLFYLSQIFSKSAQQEQMKNLFHFLCRWRAGKECEDAHCETLRNDFYLPIVWCRTCLHWIPGVNKRVLILVLKLNFFQNKLRHFSELRAAAIFNHYSIEMFSNDSSSGIWFYIFWLIFGFQNE